MVPPEAVNVDEFPLQIKVGLAVVTIVGLDLAFNEMLVVETQPAAFVPVTV